MPELCTVWEATLADSVTALRWDPGGYRLAAGSLGGDIVVFAAAGGSPRSSAGRGEGISAMAWSPDGRWLAVGDHGSTLTIMDPNGLVVETSLAGWASAVAWAPDRADVAVAAGLGVTVVDASAGLTAEYPMHPGRVNDVVWDPASGDLLVASVGGIRFYDPGAPGMEPTALAPSPGTVLALAIAPGGELVAGGSLDGSVIVWKLDDGTAKVLTGSEGGVEHVSWRCDGQQLAVAAHSELTVWRVEGGQVAQDGLIHCPVIDGPPRALAFAPSLPLLGWGGAGGVVAIWAPGLHERPVASATVTSPRLPGIPRVTGSRSAPCADRLRVCGCRECRVVGMGHGSARDDLNGRG